MHGLASVTAQRHRSAADHQARRRHPACLAAQEIHEHGRRHHHSRAQPAGPDRSGRRHRRLGRGRVGADHDRRHAWQPVCSGRASQTIARRPGRTDAAGAHARAAPRAHGQHRRALGDRDGAARPRRARRGPSAYRAGRRRHAQRGRADVAPRQSDARAGHRRGAREGAGRLPLLQAQGRHQAACDRRSKPRMRCARRSAIRRSAPTPTAASAPRTRTPMSRARAKPDFCSSSSRSATPT